MALLVAVSFASFAGGQQESGKLIIASDATWPPMEFVNADKEIVGYDIDFINAVADEAGFEIEIRNTAWD